MLVMLPGLDIFRPIPNALGPMRIMAHGFQEPIYKAVINFDSLYIWMIIFFFCFSLARRKSRRRGYVYFCCATSWFFLCCSYISLLWYQDDQGMMAYYKLWWSLTIIGPDNGLSSIQCQAIICTKAGFLSIGPWGINSSKILIKIKTFLFKKILLKMLFKMATILYQPQINVWVISNKINVNFMSAWSKFWINIKMVIQNLLLAFRKWYGCL